MVLNVIEKLSRSVEVTHKIVFGGRRDQNCNREERGHALVSRCQLVGDVPMSLSVIGMIAWW